MERLRAVVGLHYPEPGKSLEIVRAAGGLSKLSEEERAKVKIKDVRAGAWCDDLPEESRASLIRKGRVEVVEVEGKAPSKRSLSKRAK